MKSSKKKNRWLLSYYVILMVTLGLLGLFCMYLADKYNVYRPEEWNENFMTMFMETFKLGRMDIQPNSVILIAGLYYFCVLASVIFFLAFRVKSSLRGRKVGWLGFILMILMIALSIFMVAAAAQFAYEIRHPLKISMRPVLYFILGYAICAIVIGLALVAAILLGRAFRLGTSNVVVETAGDVDGIGGAGVGGTATLEEEKEEEEEVKQIFPDLIRIDEEFANQEIVINQEPASCTLPEFIDKFQAYLANDRKLYYEKRMLRSFTAGLATSRLIILEGLSGTGKSSLPRWFSVFLNCSAFFAPVQSTWRDRTDVLGFYNDFSYVFKETDFLKRMYRASYTPDTFNLMVLDEMNLSRIEYYFADFLSILEYPPEDWRVPLMTALDPALSPKNVKNGAALIPTNTWFIGTANKDDSTFTITDKVYDRAVVLDFKERNSEIHPEVDYTDFAGMTPTQMQKLFEEAKQVPEFRLTQEELAKFVELAEFVYDTFEIRFGNRIMNQIAEFVPVYVGLGGTKEEALDIMFARKVLHKIEGRFEDYIKDGLIRFQKKLDQVYGKGIFEETEELIKQMLKKLV